MCNNIKRSKWWILYRCSKIRCYQPEIDCFIYKMFYVIHKVTTKQKPRVYLQKTKKQKQNILTMEINQFMRAGKDKKRKKETMEMENNHKEINKIPLISLYMSLIT